MSRGSIKNSRLSPEAHDPKARAAFSEPDTVTGKASATEDEAGGRDIAERHIEEDLLTGRINRSPLVEGKRNCVSVLSDCERLS